jgi:hypothetical protein
LAYKGYGILQAQGIAFVVKETEPVDHAHVQHVSDVRPGFPHGFPVWDCDTQKPYHHAPHFVIIL